MSPLGFEPTISAGERPQTHALDRAATGPGLHPFSLGNKLFKYVCAQQLADRTFDTNNDFTPQPCKLA